MATTALPTLLVLLTQLFCLSFPRVHSYRAFPVCAGSRTAPVILAETLVFCGFSGLSCCNDGEDAALREEFEALNVSSDDVECTTVVKNILCKKCIPSRSLVPDEPTFNTAGSTTARSTIPPRCVSPAASPATSSGMCLERIGKGSYLNMAAHPDGSGRAFLSTQDGKIWLASIPAHGSGDTLQIHDGASPFLDLSDRVLGLMGVAFHPAFATNGRFCVCYSCDITISSTCINSAAAATGSTSSKPCQYQLVVAEFFAKYKATRADPTEVRRIFTVGLPKPHTSYSYEQHGGQILFRPTDDGHLYIMTGNGGGQKARGQQPDPKNNKSFLGKIIRFDVDSVAGQSGSASPWISKPKTVATGLSNPRGCSFDSERPSYFYCTNVDEQQHEEVHLISTSGNYSDNTHRASLIISHGRPAAGSRPTIVGGLVYRGSADPTSRGRFLYMYDFAAWAAIAAPGSSGRYASVRIPRIRCSVRTPIPCRAGGIGGRVLSFAEDNSKDAFILATGGVYRIVWPGLCGGADGSHKHGAADGNLYPWAQQLTPDYIWLLFTIPIALYLMYQVYKQIIAPCNGQTATQPCCQWCHCCDSVLCCSSSITVTQHH